MFKKLDKYRDFIKEKFKNYSIIIFSLFVLTDCASRAYYIEGTVPKPMERKVVHVVNPELSREYEILKNSELYNFTDNPKALNQLTLHKIKFHPSCGNPMFISLLTFGLIPSSFRDIYVFQFEITEGPYKKIYNYKLPILTRFSIYERLRNTDEEKELGHALRAIQQNKTLQSQ